MHTTSTLTGEARLGVPLGRAQILHLALQLHLTQRPLVLQLLQPGLRPQQLGQVNALFGVALRVANSNREGGETGLFSTSRP
jgi:hypothetical protein